MRQEALTRCDVCVCVAGSEEEEEETVLVDQPVRFLVPQDELQKQSPARCFSSLCISSSLFSSYTTDYGVQDYTL